MGNPTDGGRKSMLIRMTNKETGKETNLETSSLIVLQKALDWLDERNQSDDVSTDSFLDTPFADVPLNEKNDDCDCPICKAKESLESAFGSSKRGILPQFLMDLNKIGEQNE